MKKFIALLLATMFILSASVMAFAEYDEIGNATYVCEYCDANFKDAASLKDHIDSTFPVPQHEMECGNKCDVDFDGTINNDTEVCHEVFRSKATMEAHKSVCALADNLTNCEKALGYLKAGNIGEGLKYLGKGIVDFLKSDTFKGILDKVIGVVKGIDFSAIIGTVKNVISKIPFQEIIAKISALVK